MNHSLSERDAGCHKVGIDFAQVKDGLDAEGRQSSGNEGSYPSKILVGKAYASLPDGSSLLADPG